MGASYPPAVLRAAEALFVWPEILDYQWLPWPLRAYAHSGIAVIRTFTGYRPQPPAEYAEKGITNSGAAADYEGAIFSDGTVVIRWQTAYRSHSVWACWGDFYQVHGHPEYGTVIEFDDGQPEPEAPLVS